MQGRGLTSFCWGGGGVLLPKRLGIRGCRGSSLRRETFRIWVFTTAVNHPLIPLNRFSFSARNFIPSDITATYSPLSFLFARRSRRNKLLARAWPNRGRCSYSDLVPRPTQHRDSYHHVGRQSSRHEWVGSCRSPQVRGVEARVGHSRSAGMGLEQDQTSVGEAHLRAGSMFP